MIPAAGADRETGKDFNQAMTKAEELRSLIDSQELIQAPGVYDALTARIAQYAGFPVLYMTGYGVAASIGYPDFGLLTMTEMLERVRQISDSTDVPIVADADTGYGNAVNVYRTVKEYERAGAAAIQIEDQAWPKRCGHMEHKQVIEAGEMVDKVKAAVDARTNDQTVLVVRTDAAATHGYEEALARSVLYAEAGADMLFIEAPQPDQVKEIPSRFSKPCVLNMGFHLYNLDVKALQDMGYAMVLYPGLLLIGVIGGCLKNSRALQEERKYLNPQDLPFTFEEFNQFLGLDTFRKLEGQYSRKEE
jgi:2-methylisocitrate lyase-like PEP mutase family enzyme